MLAVMKANRGVFAWVSSDRKSWVVLYPLEN